MRAVLKASSRAVLTATRISYSGHCPELWQNSAVGKHFMMCVWEMLHRRSCVYLGDRDGAETRLSTIGEVADDLYGV